MDPPLHTPDDVRHSSAFHPPHGRASGGILPPAQRYEYQPIESISQSNQLIDASPQGSRSSAHSYTYSHNPTLSSSVATASNDPTFLPHALLPEHCATVLRSDIQTGLTPDEAARRLKEFGPNSLGTPKLSWLAVIKEEITEPLILLLLVVAGLYALWGRVDEAITAAVVVLLTISLELVNEYRAKRAVLELSSISFHAPVIVLRGGVSTRVPPEELVPGDLVDLSPGERILVDGRLVSSTWVLVDQSALTGESAPARKTPDTVLRADTPLPERSNMLHSGTLLLHGSARVLVTSTGARTELGQVKALANLARSGVKHTRTPLQIRLKEMALSLTIVAAVACMLVMSIGFMRGLAYQTVVLLGLSLAFATIPEELPLLIKAVLAVSALRLAQKNVLVKSLKTAESLGGITLVLSDKTGTLTRNELSVLRMTMPGRTLSIPRPFAKEPFRASTEDMLAFEPLIAQGWLLSSPSLVELFKSPATTTAMVGSIPLTIDPLSHPPLLSDPFDSAVVRFFSASRTQPADLNSTFLRRLFSEALTQARKTKVVHVLPYDAARRRSSCIRRVWTGGAAAPMSSATSTAPTNSNVAAPNASPSLATTASNEGQLRLCTRGGAEFVLSACSYALHSDGGVIKLGEEAREELRTQLKHMADAGLRIVGFAVRRIEQSDLDRAQAKFGGGASATSPSPHPVTAAETDQQTSSSGRSSTTSSSRFSTPFLPSSAGGSFVPYASLEERMTFLGFIGFGDTIREGVEASVKTLQRAGVQVKLVTGDFERTGAAVARAVGVLPKLNWAKSSPRGSPCNASAQAVSNTHNSSFRHAKFPPVPSSSSPRLSSVRPPLPNRDDSLSFDRERDPPDSSADESDASSGRGRGVAGTRGKKSARSRSTSRDRTRLDVPSSSSSRTERIEGVCIGHLRSWTPKVSSKKPPPSSDPSGFALPPPAANSPMLQRSPGSSSGQSDATLTPGQSASGRALASPSGLLHSPSLPSIVGYDLTAKVFCRMTPTDKLALVLAHQRTLGHSVLVTGDGPNDSAALASADAGLSMGSGGSDLAREMAGVILTTDDFRGVVTAIREGRRTLDNLRHAIRYYLACKLALVVLFLLPLSFGWDLPLSPVHVILLECFMDLGASTSFTFEPASSDIMSAKPTRWSKDGFMRGKKMWAQVVACAMLMVLAVGGVLFTAHQLEIVRPYEDYAATSAIYDTSQSSAFVDLESFGPIAFQSASPVHLYSPDTDHSNARNRGHDDASPVYDHSRRVEEHRSDGGEDHSRTQQDSSHHQNVYHPIHGAPPSSQQPLPSKPSHTSPSGSGTGVDSAHHTSDTPSSHSHSSSSFFPSILSPYARDTHLALTQALVFCAWLLSTVLLAMFMRTFHRSIWFACCDRKSWRRWKNQRARRAAAQDANRFTYQPNASSSLNSGGRQVSYNTLSSIHSRESVDPSVRVDAQEYDSDVEEGDTLISPQSRHHAPHPPSCDELEGLMKRHTEVAGTTNVTSDDDSSIRNEIFPIISNPVLLIWSGASLLFAVICVSTNSIRQLLSFSPLFTTQVRFTSGVIEGSVFPAYFVLVWPIVVFLTAELIKFIVTMVGQMRRSNAVVASPINTTQTAP